MWIIYYDKQVYATESEKMAYRWKNVADEVRVVRVVDAKDLDAAESHVRDLKEELDETKASLKYLTEEAEDTEKMLEAEIERYQEEVSNMNYRIHNREDEVDELRDEVARLEFEA